jgi:DNA-binding CsgD family transcriptional regulator
MLNWNEIVQKYIIQHSNCIQEATRPLRDHFGITYFTYHKIDSNGKYTVLVDRPDWAEHYVDKQLFLEDPYLRHPSMYTSGVTFMHEHGSKIFKKSLSQSGKQVLSAESGLLLIQKYADSVEFLGFCANPQKVKLQHLYLNHLHMLHAFGSFFKHKLQTILKKMESEANTLSSLKGNDYFTQEHITLELTHNDRLSYYKKLGLPIALQAEKLSSREIQCLKYMVLGDSMKEIAAKLGLSPRTIESYFENIKNKLSCWNKGCLFAIAKELETLHLLP